jgi:hypothetical protein
VVSKDAARQASEWEQIHRFEKNFGANNNWCERFTPREKAIIAREGGHKYRRPQAS